MKKIKLALVGCAGRMGQQIIKELQNFSNIYLIAALENKNSKFLHKKIKKINITSDKESAFKEVNTIIDFSQPESNLETVRYATKKTAIVFAPNMSVGINLLMNLVGKASNIFFDKNTSVEILDIHHKHKKDAPSGTALALGEVVVKERKFNLRNKSLMKPNKTRKKQIDKINFFCQRKGNLVGNHSVIFTNNGEEIELKHKGFSRSIYAIGALKAVLWLSNQKKGFFNMSDVLGIS